jgi:hypothetical protein
MVSITLPRRRSSERGQSMIETALLLPILLLIIFNAINFGYFFFVAVNLAAAPRSGVQYSILGPATPMQLVYADPGVGGLTVDTVAYLTYQDMMGVLPGASTARVRVCTTRLLGETTSQANCCEAASSSSACTPLGGTTAPADPEVITGSSFRPFRLFRVDVFYTVTPIIPAFELPTPAGPISLTVLPTPTFHRQVSMRAM